jgi:hypothetical protein
MRKVLSLLLVGVSVTTLGIGLTKASTVDTIHATGSINLVATEQPYSDVKFIYFQSNMDPINSIDITEGVENLAEKERFRRELTMIQTSNNPKSKPKFKVKANISNETSDKLAKSVHVHIEQQVAYMGITIYNGSLYNLVNDVDNQEAIFTAYDQSHMGINLSYVDPDKKYDEEGQIDFNINFVEVKGVPAIGQ